jgi:hypothetical protein
MPFASAQAVLQCLVPSAGTQLQSGGAHFVDDLQRGCAHTQGLHRIGDGSNLFRFAQWRQMCSS